MFGHEPAPPPIDFYITLPLALLISFAFLVDLPALYLLSPYHDVSLSLLYSDWEASSLGLLPQFESRADWAASCQC